jgi:LPS O-antigen subunit length determinant protein (WzzB/FepE family)
MNQTQDYEIDLYELCQTLWDGRLLISGCIILTVLIGLGYSQIVQPKYAVSISFKNNLYSPKTQQFCFTNLNCSEKINNKKLLYLLGSGWAIDKKKSSLLLSTKLSLDISEYEAQMERANLAITDEIYAQAEDEIEWIQTELQTELRYILLGNESVTNNMMNAKRLIKFVDGGKSALSFGSVSVSKVSPKVHLILTMSLILGGIIGAMYVLIAHEIQKRKKNFAQE